MIKLSALLPEDVGRSVTYQSYGKREYGKITSWNDKNIFVRYHLVVEDNGRTIERIGDTSAATSPEDLSWT